MNKITSPIGKEQPDELTQSSSAFSAISLPTRNLTARCARSVDGTSNNNSPGVGISSFQPEIYKLEFVQGRFPQGGMRLQYTRPTRTGVLGPASCKCCPFSSVIVRTRLHAFPATRTAFFRSVPRVTTTVQTLPIPKPSVSKRRNKN